VPHPFRVTITNKRTAEAETVVGEFPDDEWTALTQCQDAYQRLARCRMAQTQHDLSWKISHSAGNSVIHEATFPPDDDIDAFLLRMRPFVLEREKTHFYRVRNVLARRIPFALFHQHLDSVPDRYAGKTLGFTLEVGGVPLAAPEAIDKWLNAFEYHLDTDKQAELHAMFRVFPEQSARALFVHAMIERAAAIGQLVPIIDSLASRDHVERPLRG
jgi:hypothetical protein